MPATHHLRKRRKDPSIFEVGDFILTEDFSAICKLSGPEPLLRAGDRVRCHSGELRGLSARVVRYEDNNMVVWLEDLRGPDNKAIVHNLKTRDPNAVSVSVKEVEKIVLSGDNVRLRFGRHAGLGGIVLVVRDKFATFYNLELRESVSYHP